MPAPISRIAAAARNTSWPRPAAKPMVATNSPIATNDSASPAASATGPNLCRPRAAPSTIGMSGSTHGDSVERIPASNARPMPPMLAQAAGSDRFGEQRLDRAGIGIAGRTAGFLLALEHDQRALLLYVV